MDGTFLTFVWSCYSRLILLGFFNIPLEEPRLSTPPNQMHYPPPPAKYPPAANNGNSSISSKQPQQSNKASLNHLTNFSFPPRQPVQSPARRPKKSIATIPYNKESFVNAK